MQQTCVHIHIKTHIHKAPINQSIGQAINQLAVASVQKVRQSFSQSAGRSVGRSVAADRVVSCRGAGLSPPRSAPQPQVSTRWPSPLSLPHLLRCRDAALLCRVMRRHLPPGS